MFGEPAVAKNSSASEAGVKEYDIILEINGREVNEDNTLNDILSDCKIGSKITMTILRGDKEITLETILKERK